MVGASVQRGGPGRSSSGIFLCYSENQPILDGARGVPRPSAKVGYSLIGVAFSLTLLVALASTVNAFIIAPLRLCLGPDSDQPLAACLMRLDYIFGAPIALALFLFLSWVLIGLLRELWQDALFRRGLGTLLTGQITEVRKVPQRGPEDEARLLISYRFTTPRSTMVSARTVVAARASRQPMAASGKPVAILYVNRLAYRIL